MLTTGLLIRLLLAPFTGHAYDMQVWVSSARFYYESGLTSFTEIPFPLLHILLLLFYAPYALLQQVGLQDTTHLYHPGGLAESLFIKAPFILSDAAAFIILLRLFAGNAWGEARGKPLAYASLYFLNPWSIFVSSAWGMYDGVAVAFLLAGLYLTFRPQQYSAAALAFTLSGLTKAFGYLGLFILVTHLIKIRRPRLLGRLLAVTTTVIFLAYLPLLLQTGPVNAGESILQFLRGRAGLGSEITIAAGGTSYVTLLSLLEMTPTPQVLNFLLSLAVLLASFVHVWRTERAHSNSLLKVSLEYFITVFALYYLFFFRVYEQHYLWILGILPVYAYVTKNPAPAFLSLVLSYSLVAYMILGGLPYILLGTPYGLTTADLPQYPAIAATILSSQVLLLLLAIPSSNGIFPAFNRLRILAPVTGLVCWSALLLAYYALYRTVFPGGFGDVILILLVIVTLLLRKPSRPIHSGVNRRAK